MRALLTFAVALGASAALYPAFLTILVRLHAGQRIQAYGPISHGIKAGTPTMGGLLFCSVIALSWVLFDRSRVGFVAVFALLGGALLGCVDDIANIRGVGPLGLFGRQKLVMQAVTGILVGVGLDIIGATHQAVPLFGAPDLGHAIVPLAAFAVVAASNAVNLTDGVDGLAATCAAIACGALFLVAHHVGAATPALIALAAVGSLLGFLCFNWHPARIFMGDTGSLAIGCLLVALSAELHMLWLLPLLGLVFVVETASVIINVTAIRKFKRRIFRASPLHHHFEALGLREERLVVGFAAVAALAAAVTVIWAEHLRGIA